MRRLESSSYDALAQKRGFKWLGPFPSNTGIVTWWLCPKGHKWQTRYDSIKQGTGCPYCAGKARRIPADYYELARKRGFKWLGPEVRVTKDKTQWECSLGHRWGACFGDINNGRGCPHCYGKVPKIPDDYYVLAQEKNLKWLGPEVANTRIKTLWECSKGHRWETTYMSLKQSGMGCPTCGRERVREKRQKKPTAYHILAKERGFKWLGPKAPNARTKTWWQCPEGHHWEAVYDKIKRGRGCPICANHIPKTDKDYYKLADNAGIYWLGIEVPVKTNIKTNWKCLKGHCWEANYNKVQQGRGCPICSHVLRPERVKEAWAAGAYDGVFQSPTTIEIELSSALDICGIEHRPQYRPDGYGRIYDEFVPPNVLIEAHGDYWHGPKRPKQQTRDIEKAVWAQENGYSLIVMWEHEIRKQGAWSLVVERVLPLVGEGKQCVVSS